MTCHGEGRASQTATADPDSPPSRSTHWGASSPARQRVPVPLAEIAVEMLARLGLLQPSVAVLSVRVPITVPLNFSCAWPLGYGAPTCAVAEVKPVR